MTAADESKVYGAANPELTGKVVGAKNGDVLTATYTVTAVRESPVGSYDITAKVTGDALSNYDVTLKGAKLTVTRAPLSVTVDDTAKVYGDENPTFTVTYDKFVLGEDAGDLGGGLGSPPGPARPARSGAAVTPGGLTSGNYAITYEGGTLTVARGAHRDRDAGPIYGGQSGLHRSFAGFVLGEDAGVLGGELGFATGRDGQCRRRYRVAAAGLGSGNYAISYSAGTLKVTRAPLSVADDDTTKVYGEENPAFTARYARFVLGEAPGDLGGELEFATEATPSSAVDDYGVAAPGWPAATTRSATGRARSG